MPSPSSGFGGGAPLVAKPAASASAASAALGPASEPLLKQLHRDPFRGEYRRKALNKPQRALETLEPYAHLHLDVISARRLLACDVDGRSDPFVEVWLDDRLIGASARRVFTVTPTWNYAVVLQVWSPLSIVRIRVMDHDSLTKNDVVGFVEFCVADLEPNREFSGWLELRRKRHLHGIAPARVRRHRRCRDDDASAVAKRPRPTLGGGGAASLATAPGSGVAAGQRQGRPATTADLAGRRARSAEALPDPAPESLSACGGTASPGVRRSRIERCRTVLALCRGQPPLEDANPSRLERALGRVAAAGVGAAEVAANAVRRPGRSLETIFDKAKLAVNGEEDRPNSGEVRVRMRLEAAAEEDDEWYAFCFPKPRVEVLPSRVLSLEELYRDISEIRRMVTHVSQTVVCVPRYLASWQSSALSGLALAWWWCLCVRPSYVLPTVMLWPMLFLRLLRAKEWRERILVHERTVPLNDVGFRAVAAMGSTDRMKTWMRRLSVSMGHSVACEESLHEFASLSFRDGTPVISFQELVRSIPEQMWAHHATGPRKCPEGHPLVFVGSVGFGLNWNCQLPGGCMSCSSDRPWGDAAQYHCLKCCIHICEPCIAAIARPPLWTSMPGEFLPEFLESALLHIEEPLDHIREVLDLAVGFGAVPFQLTPAGRAAARSVYQACAISMAVWYVVLWLFSVPLDGVPRAVLSAVLIAVGTWTLTSKLTVTHNLLTRLRASADFNKYRRRRGEASLAARWAFFTPDAPEGNCEHESAEV